MKFVAYAVAGGILLIIADTAPKIAMGTAGLILLGVALNKSSELGSISKFIASNTRS